VNTSVPSYALWLIPRDDDAAQLSKAISHMSRRLGTPAFPPHATLCSGKWPGPISELHDAARYIAGTCATPCTTAIGLDGTPARFQAFYIKLARNGLNQALELADRVLPSAHEPAVGPHVSLAYTNDSPSKDYHDEIKDLIPSSIIFDALQLVMPKNNNWQDIDSWQYFSCDSFVGS